MPPGAIRMMPPDDPTTVITLTSHFRSRPAMWLLTLLGGNALLLACVFYLYEADTTDDRHLFLGALYIECEIFVIGSFFLWIASWGTWTIDDRELRYYPLYGPHKRLEWADVRLVFWTRDRVVLRGDHARIKIPWGALPRAQAQQGRARIEQILSADFDLKDAPVRLRVPDPRRLAVIGARLLLMAIVIFVIWVGVGYLIVNYIDRPESWRAIAFAGWTYILLLILVRWAGSDELRRTKLVHPRWPWRMRRLA